MRIGPARSPMDFEMCSRHTYASLNESLNERTTRTLYAFIM